MRYKIIIEANRREAPKDHEFAAATVIAAYFKADVTFIKTDRFRTPDFTVAGIRWELKSPLGNSARTIENNLRAARKQSANIIIDLSRSKLQPQRAMARLRYFLSRPNQFERVLVITKGGKVIEIL